MRISSLAVLLTIASTNVFAVDMVDTLTFTGDAEEICDIRVVDETGAITYAHNPRHPTEWASDNAGINVRTRVRDGRISSPWFEVVDYTATGWSDVQPPTIRNTMLNINHKTLPANSSPYALVEGINTIQLAIHEGYRDISDVGEIPAIELTVEASCGIKDYHIEQPEPPAPFAGDTIHDSMIEGHLR